MMERLRGKGYLKRRQLRGMFRYSTATAPKEAMRSAVGSFVEKTLSGSVSPFVAWMSERAEVSDSELSELEALVARLQTKRKES
jgi:predicted transcriptional regulator